jgi:hypothetical protein
VTYQHDSAGNLTSVDYHPNGHLTSKNQGSRTSTYTYGAMNRRTEVSSPSGTVQVSDHGEETQRDCNFSLAGRSRVRHGAGCGQAKEASGFAKPRKVTRCLLAFEVIEAARRVYPEPFNTLALNDVEGLSSLPDRSLSRVDRGISQSGNMGTRLRGVRAK